jgi:primosomal protein N' (replication factor Y)
MGESGASSGNADMTVKVLVPLPLGDPYDYLAPVEGDVVPGSIVRVPLGPRDVVGVVWAVERGAGLVARDRLKRIAEVLPVAPLPDELRRFIDWVATYTISPPGSVLRMAMSTPEAFGPPPQETLYVRGATAPERLTPARRRVLEILQDGVPRRAAEIAEQAAVSSGVIRSLAASGALVGRSVTAEKPFRPPGHDHAPLDLSPAQREAAAALTDWVSRGAFTPVLLEGVTGSGKTAVYFEAVAEALRAGKSTLVLVPEIALTSQWLERFEERFGVEPALWHSDLSRVERRRTWRAVAEGRAPVVVGARSALFLPFRDLGLVVVDEEHDSSFKQEDGVAYNARDMAIVRAQIASCPVVLVSATPSLETVVNARSGRYEHLTLDERHGAAELPHVDLVDMRREGLPADRWLSASLVQAVAATLEAGEQALLFLNRRGYAPLTLCRGCGHRFQCPNCMAWLVEHRHRRRLQCHHCDFSMAMPEACPACDAKGKFAACGPGVERLAEEVAERFPEARTAVLASDTLSGPARAAELIGAIERHELDLLIGTQVIAKGFHFPLLTLVGVVDADLGLAGGDLRAAERTYQLLSQVAGRAGRDTRPGRVILQTHLPEHPVLVALAAGQRDAFVERELAERRLHGMPPFGRLVALIVSSADEAAARQTAAALRRAAPHQPGMTVLGPAPAPMALLRGRHRFRLLLKAEKQVPVQTVVQAWLARVRWPGRVRVSIDVDPYSFL